LELILKFRNGYYIGANEDGDIKIDKEEDFTSGSFQRYGKWKIMSRENSET
jgi:hypothetical protein